MTDQDLARYIKCLRETVAENMDDLTLEELMIMSDKIKNLTGILRVAYKNRTGRDMDATVH